MEIVDCKTYGNQSHFIGKIMRGKHVVGGSENLESITQFINQRYSIPFHLSEQKVFLAFGAIAIAKSLPKQITYKIDKM